MNKLICLIAVFGLVACGANGSDSPAQDAEATTSKSTHIDTQLETLDKATAVEQTLQDGEHARRLEMQDRGI